MEGEANPRRVIAIAGAAILIVNPHRAPVIDAAWVVTAVVVPVMPLITFLISVLVPITVTVATFRAGLGYRHNSNERDCC